MHSFLFRFFTLSLFILFCLSCDSPAKKKKQKEKITDGIVKTTRSDGSPLSELTLKGGKKNGISRSFYTNGKMSIEMKYIDNKREGLSRRFYEDGTLYQETVYKNDKIEGLRKKYRENGKLMSIARFENGNPCNQLKEFRMDGTESKGFPTIWISPQDDPARGNYKLIIRMSNKAKKVEYFQGRLTASGCLDKMYLKNIYSPESGMGEIFYSLLPGQFIMEEILIVAQVTTLMGNDYITTASYNLSIRN